MFAYFETLQRCMCANVRDMLVSSTQRKEELEKDVFEQRYALGVQRSTCIQLQKCFDNTTLAVSRFIQVRNVQCSIALFTPNIWRRKVPVRILPGETSATQKST